MSINKKLIIFYKAPRSRNIPTPRRAYRALPIVFISVSTFFCCCVTRYIIGFPTPYYSLFLFSIPFINFVHPFNVLFFYILKSNNTVFWNIFRYSFNFLTVSSTNRLLYFLYHNLTNFHQYFLNSENEYLHYHQKL